MDNSKIFVTGGNGYIGSKMVSAGCSNLTSDITDPVELDLELKKKQPEVVIHLAGKSDVDLCELCPRSAELVNYKGSLNVFSMTEKNYIPCVFISSDHVFSGDLWGSYQEDNKDLKPKNYYGLLKMTAEAATTVFENVKVVRTSTLLNKTRPIISHYLQALTHDEETYPPFFIWRSFMHVNHFVKSLIHYANNIYAMPKVLHISGSKNVSWWRLVKTYAEEYGLPEHLIHPRYMNIDIPGTAKRPYRGGLSTLRSEKLGFKQYDYRDCVAEDF